MILADRRPCGARVYTGELIIPVRRMLDARAGFEIWTELTNGIQSVIHEALGLQWPPHSALQKMVHDADKIMLATERRDILADGPGWEIPMPAPDKQVIRPWTWVESHHNFMERFSTICKMRPEMAAALKSFGRGE